MERQLRTIIGVLLIALGILSLAYGAISFTRREKVLDLGPVEATAERHERIPLPPVVGIGSIVGGLLVLAFSRKR